MCGFGVIVRTYSGDESASELSPGSSFAYSYVPFRSSIGMPWKLGAHDENISRAGAMGGEWKIDEHWLEVLDSGISWRGPDAIGRFRGKTVREDGTITEVAMVHRRLSIVDHAGGKQPMVAPPLEEGITTASGCGMGVVAVVFNGCIYNHRELRRELEGCGHVFQSDHSDTEVLIHGWRQWGEKLHEHLDGMYAFAIWDGQRGDVVTMRDRFGEKPVYFFHLVDQGFSVVSSSVHGLAPWAAGWFAPANFRGPDGPLLHMVEFGYATALQPIAGTSEQDPGSVWSYRRLHAKKDEPSAEQVSREDVAALYMGRKWFSVPRATRDSVDMDHFESLLSAAVKERLDADVPVACLLSGGVDSSLVSLMARRHRESVTTICVKMPVQAYDEAEYAKRVAAVIGTNHVEVAASATPADDLYELIPALGVPFGDSSLLPTFWAFQAAAKHAKVVLTGDGGDELCYGYERYAALNRTALCSVASLVPSCLISRRDPKSAWSKLARLGEAWVRRGYIDLLAVFPYKDAERVIAKDVQPHRYDRGLRVESWASPSYVRDIDLDMHFPCDLLGKVDAASMMAGVEARSPFLDAQLSTYAMECSWKAFMRERWGRTRPKAFLKRLARKHLPAEVVDRPKMGFAVPVGEWFRNDYGGMRQLLHDLLLSSEPFGPSWLGVEELINMEYVKRMMREHDEAGEKGMWWKGRDHGQRLYVMLVLSIWARWLGERVRTEEANA